MRDKILEIIRQAAGEISGQTLSEQLQISRAAVGKHVKSLREQGYQIEASPHVGYRFISAPNKLYPAEIKHYLPDDTPWQILWQEQVDSTNNALRREAQEGAPSFCALVTEQQTAGRGRLGRSWHSPESSGIWLSILLRPQLPPEQAQFFTLTTAVAVTEALRYFGYDVTIKWPNDLLLNGKKICGILAEMQADPDILHWVIVGIGVNCYPSALPPELQDTATSLQATEPRAEITAAILQAIEKYYDILCRGGFAAIRKYWLKYSDCIGKRITARTNQGQFCGIARDIDEQGYLNLEMADGQIKKIITGDINLN